MQAAARSPVLAHTMFTGVRLGGGPYSLASYRWGYGWPHGRLYQPLSEQEEAQATFLRAAYLANSEDMVCRKDVIRSPEIVAGR